MGGLYLLIFFYNFLCFFAQDISFAAQTITPSQSISDGETLLSKGGTFELGFFSPPNSKSRYIGIWYKIIPIQTVVWVANRDSPLNDTAGVLKIGLKGNLVLVNQTGSIIWSSNSSKAAENPVLKLLDSGNLVLTENSGKNSEIYLWESFNYPSDTLLPGMKLGWNLKTGLNRYLSSWKNFDNPSLGGLTYGVELHRYPDVVIRDGSIEYYRTGPWNGLHFSGSPKSIPNPDKSSFTNNEDEVYYMYQISDDSIISRFVLNETSDSGVLQRLTWVNQSRNWVHISIIRDICDTYGLCGAFSICDMNDAPVCQCLTGFKPRSLRDWNALDWSQGCVHERPLDCRKGDGFFKFKEVKLPDTKHTWVNMSMSLEECRAECLKNCSCMAYTSFDISQGGSGCVMWFSDLIDIKQLNNAGQDIYIRMAASELENKVPSSTDGKKTSFSDSGNNQLWVIVTMPIVLTLLISTSSMCCVWMRKHKQKEKETGQDLLQFDFSVGVKATNSLHTDVNKLRNGGKNDVELPLFSFTSIGAATNDFSAENKLGEGGFGPVYKGKLLRGHEVAVKRLSRRSGQGNEEFKNEITLIAKLQHRNLVRLLGYCIQGEENILVYEYMSNKSLDYFIFDSTKRELLDWRRRIHIIEGIAQGLLYLHQYSRVRIIHRDLKASNILLDSNMNPKISDFGMARIFGGNELQANTKRIVGTYGYMSPEYATRGHFSIKSDVFSFGVLLLEILSGRKNSEFCISNSLNLLACALELWESNRGIDLLDPMMGNSFSMDGLMRYIHVALLCVEESATDRPTMSDVISMLSNESASLPSPKRIAFSNEHALTDARSNMTKHKVCSSNDVTISILDGR